MGSCVLNKTCVGASDAGSDISIASARARAPSMSACVVPPWTSSTTHGAPSHAHRYLIRYVLPQPHSPISTTGMPHATRAWIASILSSASPVRQ